MRLKVSIFGRPEISTEAKDFKFHGNTFSDLLSQFVERYSELSPSKDILLGFVNGQSIGRNPKDVILNEGDSVLIVLPISGG